MDLSKTGVDFAAKRLKTARYAVATAAALPFDDEKFDAVFCVFAPVFIKEYARVVNKGGKLIIVTPAERHLYALKVKLYDEPYLNERQTFAAEGFKEEFSEVLSSHFTVSGSDVEKLVGMTPYAYKTAPDRLNSVKALPELEVEREFSVTVLTKIF